MTFSNHRKILICGIISISFVISISLWYKHRRSSYFILHSSSELYRSLDYIAPHQDLYSIPADSKPVFPQSKQNFEIMFENFYVVKDSHTDCSFVSAFMLLFRRDPEYPFRILYSDSKLNYYVRFPGLETDIIVNAADLRNHYAAIEKGRGFLRKLIKGHSPLGLEIIRCAYYKYQRDSGLREIKKDIYGGGWPDRDLMILSGIKKTLIIDAADCPDGTSEKDRCFNKCNSIIVETRRVNGNFQSNFKSIKLLKKNPFSWISNFDHYFIIAASNKKAVSITGSRVIPNHAHYFIGRLDRNRYIFGNPYQTRRPLVIEEDEILSRFKTIYLIKKQI